MLRHSELAGTLVGMRVPGRPRKGPSPLTTRWRIRYSRPTCEWLLRMWAYCNEFSIWSLMGMALSGAYLGLSSRPKYRPARYALASGVLVFLAFYIATRW